MGENSLVKIGLVNIYNREKIEVVGAVKVVSSTASEIYLQIDDGSIMQILGENLNIIKLIPDEKLLTATGKINGVNYVNKMSKKSFLDKVFK